MKFENIQTIISYKQIIHFKVYELYSTTVINCVNKYKLYNIINFDIIIPDIYLYLNVLILNKLI